MRGSWRSFLPLTIALFCGIGDCQRDFAGQFDRSPSLRTESASKESNRQRVRNQVSSGPTNKMFSLFQVHSPPPTLDDVSVTPQTGRENGKSPSLTNVRSSDHNLAAKANVPGRTLIRTLQHKQRMGVSQQRLQNEPRSRAVPQPRIQTSRGRMVG